MINRIKNLFNNPNFRITYIFARFKVLRTFSKFFKIIIYRYTNKNFVMGKIKKKNLILIRHKPIASRECYIEYNKNKDDILKQLKTDGLYEGIYLKKDTQKNLLLLSDKCKLFHAKNKKIFNNLNEVNQFNLNNKNPCTIVDLINDDKKKISDLEILIDEVSRDKNILSLANNYLGNVNKIYTRFTWSTVCDSDEIWRKKEQTVDFHYDVHDFGFVYVFFYLTECDKFSGAHEVIIGSHNKKKLRFLFNSAKSNENELKSYYNKDNFKLINGSSGFGFIEDTSAFHKAHAPIKKPRLALQIRYH